MIYLLDSTVWVAILRNKHPEVAVRYGATDPAEIRICSVVVAELRHGCLKSAKPTVNRAILDALLAPVVSLPFDDIAADHFSALRHHLESIGQMIGPYDAQIAAIALANGCTLVTHNVSEFSRVPGLVVEDWQNP
ncbi:MAG: type II toxin-antitoxin system VapC family toxin [Planctomycetia bacterium]|nr:type II toxin-antitoxin system VapC family toxin [Planctomycetia bacterium]